MLPIERIKRNHVFANGLLKQFGMRVAKHATSNTYFVLRGERIIGTFTALTNLFSFIYGVYVAHGEQINDILE
jgi:hypothetical protein